MANMAVAHVEYAMKWTCTTSCCCVSFWILGRLRLLVLWTDDDDDNLGGFAQLELFLIKLEFAVNARQWLSLKACLEGGVIPSFDGHNPSEAVARGPSLLLWFMGWKYTRTHERLRRRGKRWSTSMVLVSQPMWLLCNTKTGICTFVTWYILRLLVDWTVYLHMCVRKLLVRIREYTIEIAVVV